MFKAIAAFFRIFTEVFESVEILARTGKKYTEQFEADAELQLRKKRHELSNQEALFLSVINDKPAPAAITE